MGEGAWGWGKTCKVWNSFILSLQGAKDENLVDGTGSYGKLAKFLPQFAAIGKFRLDRFGCINNELDTIKRKFEVSSALYHKSCVDEYNQ